MAFIVCNGYCQRGGNNKHIHRLFVKDEFDEIKEQIHEIRNFISPLDLRLENLGHQIEKSRLSFELKTTQLENKIAEHSTELAQHTEQIRQIQLFLKMPVPAPARLASPVRGDELSPPDLPPIPPSKN